MRQLSPVIHCFCYNIKLTRVFLTHTYNSFHHLTNVGLHSWESQYLFFVVVTGLARQATVAATAAMVVVAMEARALATAAMAAATEATAPKTRGMPLVCNGFRNRKSRTTLRRSVMRD